jgi:death-on-curing protein
LGFGIARNHPFVDGNKRTAYVAVETFLALNGLDLVAGDAECVVVMLDLAAGDLPEAGFAAWLRDNTKPRG